MSYLPTRNIELMLWIDNFVDLIQANPTNYGLVAGDATALDAVRDPFRTAFDLAQDINTRTQPVVAGFNAQKSTTLTVIREYAMIVLNDPGVSNELKTGLGLVIPSPPSRIPPPTTIPLVTILYAQPQTHTLRYADSTTPASRAKPAGVTSMQVFRTIATAPASDPDAASFVNASTTNPVLVSSSPSDAGKIATYFCRWANRRGEVGPWSNPVSMMLI